MPTLRRAAALVSPLLLLPVLAVTAVASPSGAAPVSDGALFRALEGFQLPKSDLSVRPQDYRAYRVDVAGLRTVLADEGVQSISVPDPTGEPVDFTVVEESVMEP